MKLRAPLTIVGTLGFALFVGACVVTDGDGDGDSDGASGAPGSGGTSGTGGASGSSGSAGAAGSAGNAGSGGMAGAAIDGGAGQGGADAGPIVPIPPGYTRAVTLYHGSEALLVGGDGSSGDSPGAAIQREGYAATSFAVSDDGATIWVTIRNEFVAPEDQWEVWSVRADGSDPQRSPMTFESPGSYPAGVAVRTNETGTVAIVTAPHAVGAPGLPDRGYTFKIASDRGAPFSKIASTDDMMPAPSLGLAQPIYPKMTEDGQSLLFNTGPSIWRMSQSGGWVPFEVGRKADLRFNGNAPPSNVRFQDLDISANGGQWMTTIEFRDTETHEVVLTGMSIPSTTFEAVETDKFPLGRVQIDDAGETVAYTYGGPSLGDVRSYVGEQGGVVREILTDLDGVADVALSGNGQLIHCLNKPSSFATVHTSFFENAQSGAGRVKAHSNFFGGRGISGGEMDDAGSVMAALVDIDTSPLFFGGLWVVHPQVSIAGSPDITSVSYRYDDTDDSLVVRVTVEPASGDEVKNVVLRPLKDRYVDPSVFVPAAENPFFFARQGQTLNALDGEPGAYEAVLDLDGKRSFIDGSYSLRVAVQSGPAGAGGYRAAFVDFHPMN